MRKWLIKNFIGERWTKIPFTNKWTTSYKGGFPLFASLSLIGGLILLGIPQFIILPLSLTWLAFTLYFTFPLKGFGYFEMFPVKWHELDNMQKWYFGSFVNSGNSIKKDLELTPEQFEEWMELNKKFRKKFGIEFD